MARPHLWAKTPWALITDPHLTPSARRLYDYLDVRAGRRGWWYGAQQEISDALNISLSTVRSAAKLLREQGYIETVRTIEHRTTLKYFMLARHDPDRAEVGNPPAVAQPTPSRTDVRPPEIWRSDRQKSGALRARVLLSDPIDHTIEGREKTSSSNGRSARDHSHQRTTTHGDRLERGLLDLGIDPPPGFGERFADVDWPTLTAALERVERGAGRTPGYFECALRSELRVRKHRRGLERVPTSGGLEHVERRRTTWR